MDSVSKPQPRLYRTLRRKPVVRDLTEDDFGYLWAAYKKGSFARIEDRNLSPAEFKALMTEHILNNYHYSWILGDKPVGIYHGVDHGIWVLGGDAEWFPWATNRQIIEHAVQFFNEIRRQLYMVFFCEQQDKNFYVHLAKHSIIRRVGTLYGSDHRPLWEVRYEPDH